MFWLGFLSGVCVTVALSFVSAMWCAAHPENFFEPKPPRLRPQD